MSLTSARIVPYRAKAYDYRSFSCGSHDLDVWLSTYAGQSERRYESRTYILVDDVVESREVHGYFALQNCQIDIQQASEVRGRAPRYPMAATLLTRLAVSCDMQGKGFGKLLLVEAMTISVRAAHLTGSFVLLVDALDENAQRFYERYGFERFRESRRLFLPMKTIFQSVNEARKK